MPTNREEWQPLLDDLARRRTAGRAMGGAKKVARYTAGGRPHARRRIEMLLDRDSFVEIGRLAGSAEQPADGFVGGHGTIAGRPVLVGAEDFTVAGGSIGIAAATKRQRLARLALQERVPLVMVLEGAGHRATNALARPRPAPNDLQAMTDLAGLVPTVAIVVGPSAGHSALTASMCDFVIMVEGTGALFAAGPPLVAAATGERVDKQDLGGADVHCRASGVADLAVPDDSSAMTAARSYLSYFSSNAWQHPPRLDTGDGPRLVEELLDLVPPRQQAGYDMREVVAAVADNGSAFELAPEHAGSLLTTLVRIGGHSVAVLANQPRVLAGSIDAAAAHKATRFLQVAGAFHLPALFLADNPGVLAGTASERAGILRAGARMFAAQRRLRGPKFHVTVRKAFGFGSSVMGMNAFDEQTLSLAFPGVTLGGIPAAVGGSTAGADDATTQALLDHEAGGPWDLAATVTYDEVIDPRELRNRLLEGLRLAADRLEGPTEPVWHLGHLP